MTAGQAHAAEAGAGQRRHIPLIKDDDNDDVQLGNRPQLF